jgi:hypothetical protein
VYHQTLRRKTKARFAEDISPSECLFHELDIPRLELSYTRSNVIGKSTRTTDTYAHTANLGSAFPFNHRGNLWTPWEPACHALVNVT